MGNKRLVVSYQPEKLGPDFACNILVIYVLSISSQADMRTTLSNIAENEIHLEAHVHATLMSLKTE